jgi:uncharacterized protein (DUF4213/DUF364 family)
VDAAADKAEAVVDAVEDKVGETTEQAKEIILEGPSADTISEVFETGTVEEPTVREPEAE